MSRKEELIKEAFERFGEIQPDDRFDRPFGSFLEIPIRQSLIEGFEPDFRYYEDKEEGEEILEYQGVMIYYTGVWATKVEPKPKGVLKFKNDEARMLAEIIRHLKNNCLFSFVPLGHMQPYLEFINYLQLKCEKLSKDERRSGYKNTDTEEDFHKRILKRWTKK